MILLKSTENAAYTENIGHTAEAAAKLCVTNYAKTLHQFQNCTIRTLGTYPAVKRAFQVDRDD
jgi:hypothetical protein